MVRPEPKIIHDRLLVAQAEAGEDFDLYVGLEVAIGVFEIPNIRRGGHKDAALPRHDATGPQHSVREHMAFIEHAVAVSVAKQANGAEWLFPRLWLVGIVAHLANIELPVLIKLGRDRAGDERLVRHQLHAKPVDNFKRFQRFIGRLGWNWFEVLLELFFRLAAVAVCFTSLNRFFRNCWSRAYC